MVALPLLGSRPAQASEVERCQTVLQRTLGDLEAIESDNRGNLDSRGRARIAEAVRRARERILSALREAGSEPPLPAPPPTPPPPRPTPPAPPPVVPPRPQPLPST